MTEEAPTVETSVLSMRHAAPDSQNAEARGLTATQHKNQILFGKGHVGVAQTDEGCK